MLWHLGGPEKQAKGGPENLFTPLPHTWKAPRVTCFPSRAQRHSVQHAAGPADDGRLANDDAGAVVDEQPWADPGCGMDVQLEHLTDAALKPEGHRPLVRRP